MTTPGWTRSETPFHAGELAIHSRLGVREEVDKVGRRLIREFLPEQHRQFFANLAYLIVGSTDRSGTPWASIRLGNSGFISSPDPRTLRVAAKPLWGDPLGEHLATGSEVGLLGIELSTRRRNRLNGVVTALDADSFEVRVVQSFGNCPKYIQARTFEWTDFDPGTPRPVRKLTTLTESERALITAADTFFIATAYQTPAAGAASGVDVSHRGGKPGFVRLDGNDTLIIPDFHGNCLFNTFGNIEMNPRTGLLFVDFGCGDLLYLAGSSTVVWEGEEIRAYAGAERLLTFQPEHGIRIEGSLPLQWSAPEFSPALTGTGAW